MRCMAEEKKFLTYLQIRETLKNIFMRCMAEEKKFLTYLQIRETLKNKFSSSDSLEQK